MELLFSAEGPCGLRHVLPIVEEIGGRFPERTIHAFYYADAIGGNARHVAQVLAPMAEHHARGYRSEPAQLDALIGPSGAPGEGHRQSAPFRFCRAIVEIEARDAQTVELAVPTLPA